MVSEKKFLTKLGSITVPRRIFQQDNGGKTYVPLDVAWEMVGEFATRDVRECVLYITCSHAHHTTLPSQVVCFYLLASCFQFSFSDRIRFSGRQDCWRRCVCQVEKFFQLRTWFGDHVNLTAARNTYVAARNTHANAA